MKKNGMNNNSFFTFVLLKKDTISPNKFDKQKSPGKNLAYLVVIDYPHTKLSQIIYGFLEKTRKKAARLLF